MKTSNTRVRKIAANEGGATLVIVAILLIVLIGFTAFAVDVARAYGERRELQRTADVAAISGATQLPVGVGSAIATGEYYIGENPSLYHPGPFNSAGGDLVTASSTCNIPGLGVYPCVKTRVVTPEFPFLFAPVLNADFDTASISATATAVLGTGAPGGSTLIPWVLMDCARSMYGEDPSWDNWNPSCSDAAEGGYKFSADWANGPFVKLYNTNGDGSNFQAVAYDPEPNCPLTYDGLFDHGGANNYTEFLEGTAGDLTPCNIDKGARVFTKPGNMGNPTDMALDRRNGEGIEGCMNEDAFEDTDGAGPDEGAVTIIDEDAGLIQINEPNPCLVQITLVVHANPDYPGIFTDIPGGCCVEGMQHPIAEPNEDLSVITRLSDFNNGTPQRMLARRFAFFYITHRGTNADPWRYQGLFMKGTDSRFSELGGSTCDPLDGICTVKQIYDPNPTFP